MKSTPKLFAGAILAGCLALPAGAQRIPPTGPADVLGAERKLINMTDIEIRNTQNEHLGRIRDLGIDLVNGRIVVVLVVSNEFLGMGGKTVAVPPRALTPDAGGAIYRINISAEKFKSAPEINLSKWTDEGRSDRVAAAYHLFGQETYFLEGGDIASKTDERPKVMLGHVERSSKITNMPVGNFQNEKFGKVLTMTYDIPKGRILNVVVRSPGNFGTSSVVPAMALSFNAKRDGLLLDDTKEEFADEPRYVYTQNLPGNAPSSAEEAYKGPHTSVALEQGNSYRDVDRTIQINLDIRNAKINARNVEVGTINGRVTLRGWVNSPDDKRRIGEIAIAASRLEIVDNQITVGRPLAAQ